MPQGDITTIHLDSQKGKTNEELIFSSIYMPYGEQTNIPDETACEAIRFSAESGIPIIIGADCNAHHALWCSSNTNMRGEKLVEYLASTELELLNTGNSPTFSNRNRKEIIDISLASQSISNRIKNWTVSPEETLFDHKEIQFTLECNIDAEILFRNPKNTNWSRLN